MTDPLSANLAAILRDLGKAGKIASDWLPGMLVDFVLGQREAHPLSASSYPRRITSRSDTPRFLGQADGEIVVGPVVDDPATMGCLLALVREAHNDPLMYAASIPGRRHGTEDIWLMMRSNVSGGASCGKGPTEAHAILTALHAALPTETP